MPVYVEKFNAEQRKALESYEAICGFEPMYQDDFESGEITFYELWNENVSWLEGVLAGVVNISFDSKKAEYFSEDKVCD